MTADTDFDIDLSKISTKENPRTVFDKDAHRELVAAVKSVGLLNRIVVREVEGGYQLVAGERRLRAYAELAETNPAGFGKIPCTVREVDDEMFSLIQLLENSAREGLTPLDEAMAVSKALESMGEDTLENRTRLGGQLGWGTSKLREMLALADSSSYVQRFGKGFSVEIPDLDENNMPRTGEDGSKLTRKKVCSALHGSLLRLLVRGNSKLLKHDEKQEKLKGAKYRHVAEKTINRLGEKAAIEGLSVKALDAEIKKAIARHEGKTDAGLEGDPPQAGLPKFKDGKLPALSAKMVQGLPPEEQDMLVQKVMAFCGDCGWKQVRISRI